MEVHAFASWLHLHTWIKNVMLVTFCQVDMYKGIAGLRTVTIITPLQASQTVRVSGENQWGRENKVNMDDLFLRWGD